MSLFGEFKAFVKRGNVLDLAVGVVIGAAFGRIVASFVSDLLMPPIGMLFGKSDFSSLFWSLNGQSYASLAAAQAAGAPVVAYGRFIDTVIQFAIVAAAIFLVVRAANRMFRLSAATKPCPECTLDVPAEATRCPHCTAMLASGPRLTVTRAPDMAELEDELPRR